MAYSVTERTREFGIRVAFGAQQKDVLRIVFYRGMLLTGIGMAIGLPIALAMSQAYGQSALRGQRERSDHFQRRHDPAGWNCLLACYIPARRAMQVDPMMALRYE